MPINFFNIYIKAWSNYEEDKLMKMLQQYFNSAFRDSNDWLDIKYFHKNFYIKSGDYFGVDSNYAIGNSLGEVVWEGDYPTEDAIREVINNY